MSYEEIKEEFDGCVFDGGYGALHICRHGTNRRCNADGGSVLKEDDTGIGEG